MKYENTCPYCSRSFTNKGAYTNHYKSCSKTNHLFFREETPLTAWVLGLIAADGCVVKNAIKISQSGDDGFKLISYLSEIISGGNPIGSHLPKIGRRYYIIRFPSQILVDELYELGITPRKSLTIEKVNIQKEFKSFIRGYFEGDGCIGISSPNQCIKDYLNASFVGNPPFIEWMLSKIPFSPSDLRTIGNVLQARFSGENGVRFCDWLFEDKSLYESYKQKIYLNYLATAKKPRWCISNEKRREFDKIFFDQNEKRVIQVAKKIGVHFQTCYHWINKNQTQQTYKEIGDWTISV